MSFTFCCQMGVNRLLSEWIGVLLVLCVNEMTEGNVVCTSSISQTDESATATRGCRAWRATRYEEVAQQARRHSGKDGSKMT